MFSKSQNFDKLLDKATSHLSLEPDWPSIIKICDLIRQKDVQPKAALASIKKKMVNPNPHTALFSLSVLESCVKNCGSLIHDEIGTKAFMEQLKDLIKTTPHTEFKSKLLEMIQVWAHAFRNNLKYRAIQDTVNILKTDGYQFPTLKESDAMFVADTAPVWSEGTNCNRCRTDFTVLVRKHHCRNCGQVFCSACTSQSCTLPRFGIEKEVRVCDTCYTQVTKPLTSGSKIDDLPIEYLNSSLAQQSQAPPPRKSEAELKEEEELNLAIALSQSEAESAKNKFHTTPRSKSYSPPPKISVSPEQDPELARYLNRSYWQQQSLNNSNNSASAPSQYSQPNLPNQNGVNETEIDEFVSTLSSQVEMFENRMKSNSSRGRPIANDSSVQTLFLNITAMHSKLLSYIQQQDDNRVFYEGLQDKLVQIKDARAALDALREEHKEKLIREAELAERRRQMQMAEKLNLMRKKKQEYLQYQRQLALQRIQDQEREMQIRQEQQKQQYSMAPYALPFVPPGYAMPQQNAIPPRFPNQGYPPFNPGAMPVDPMPHMGNMGLGINGPLMVGTDPNMMIPPGSLPRGPMIHPNNIPNSQHLMMPMAPSMNMGQVNHTPVAAQAPPMSPAPQGPPKQMPMMPPMIMNQAPYMNPQPQERFVPHSQSEEDTTATLISFD